MTFDELPAGWCAAKLSDVATQHSGNSKLIKGKLSAERQAGMHPAYSATGQDVWREAFEQEGSAIIISAVGARCGKCFKADGRWSAIANTHIVWPIEEIADRDFLWFKLNDERFWVRGGSAQPFVKTKESFKHEFGLPPLPEQQRIVEKIETLFAELDKGEEALREVQKLLARYRQSVLKAAVTGTLTADWRAANGQPKESGKDLLARILKTRRDTWQGRGKYKAPVEPDTDGLPELPEGWTASTTDQLAFVDTGATPKKGRSDYYEGGEIPWVTSTAVNQQLIDTPQDFITRLAVKETNAKVFPAGTLIVALYGEGKTRGKVSKLGIDAATNQACAGLRVGFLPAIIADYVRLFYVYNYEAIRLLSAGGVQPNLNLSIIRQTLVPLPPLEEVQQIIDTVDEAMERVSHVESLCETELKRSAALRQSILKDAFSGKLVPQDPSDEPADKLLERIRAARKEQPKAKRMKANA